MEMKTLVGETLTHIDVFSEEILLTLESGRKVKVYHSQDCCENVWLENVEGDFKELVGKVLIDVSEEVDPDGDQVFAAHDEAREYPAESKTNTRISFVVDGATVITRWIGESNGYYSEGVTFAEI